MSVELPFFTTSYFVLSSDAETLNPNKIYFYYKGSSNFTAKIRKNNSDDTKIVFNITTSSEGADLYSISASVLYESVTESPSIYEGDTIYNIWLGVVSDNKTYWSAPSSFSFTSDLSLGNDLQNIKYFENTPITFTFPVNKSDSCTDSISQYKYTLTVNNREIYSSGFIENLNVNKLVIVPPIQLWIFDTQDDRWGWFIDITYITKYGNVGFKNTDGQLRWLDNRQGIGVNYTVIINPYEDLGINRLQISCSAADTGQHKYQIFRSSSENNYLDWHLIGEKSIYFTNKPYFIWDDRTIDCQYEYKYRIIDDYDGGLYFLNQDGNYEFTAPENLKFESIFLTSPKAQLIVTYNPDISNLKRNITDSIQNTLGGEYPKITRTAKTKYRSFSVGGLITYNTEYIDGNETITDSLGGSYSPGERAWMTSCFKMYHGGQDNFGSSIIFDYSVEQFNDLLSKDPIKAERAFREQVMDFLYGNDIKMFRSAIEGNMFVKLTNIQLTPEKQLGRVVYSFTATATEVAEINDENMKRFGFVDPTVFNAAINPLDYYVVYIDSIDNNHVASLTTSSDYDSTTRTITIYRRSLFS